MAIDKSFGQAEEMIADAKRTGATFLDLSGLNLTELPESLGQLTQLHAINLSRNKLTELPDSLGHLKQLRRLDLEGNNFTLIPKPLYELTQLETLWLGVGGIGNNLESLANDLTKLRQLSVLGLASCELQGLPDWIGEFSNLERLHLNHNQISDIPVSLSKLTGLHSIELDSNPLNPELNAAYKEGIGAVKAYLLAKADEQLVLNEAKLILIGEGEVGKSCLLDALRDVEWSEHISTHGITIAPVTVTDSESGTDIKLNGWDFGGQRVYRPTHQLFFSSPAVYLVVWKPREGSQAGQVKEWIKLVKHREPDAKILVVATHGGPKERQPDIDKYEIMNSFGEETIRGFFHVDSKPDENGHRQNIQELRDKIAQVAMQLPEVGREIPAKWQRLRERLDASEQSWMPYSDFIEFCTNDDRGAALELDQVELFAKLSHTLGHLIHYDYDSLLREVVILKPDWLATAISFVLDDSETRESSGLVSLDRLGQLWNDPARESNERYPEILHTAFLRLMERFDLSYDVELPDREDRTILVSQLVPDNRPNPLPVWDSEPQLTDNQQVQICRIVDDRGDSESAEGLFYQLITRLHKFSLGRVDFNDSVHWQRGLLLNDEYNGCALLTHEGNNIRIAVRAAYPERFLSVLTSEVKWLVESFWEGLRCEVMVPCIEPCGKNAPGTGLFEVADLIASKQENRDEYPCDVSGCRTWQNINALLRNAPSATREEPITSAETEQLEAIREMLAVLVNKWQSGASGPFEMWKAKLRFLQKEEAKATGELKFEIQQAIIEAETKIGELAAPDGIENILLRSLLSPNQLLDDRQQSLMSQADNQFDRFMQKYVDEAKEGPRLISFECDDPSSWSLVIRFTPWCEHARLPSWAVSNDDTGGGTFEAQLNASLLHNNARYLQESIQAMRRVLPLASSARSQFLSEHIYKKVTAQLETAEQLLLSAYKPVTPMEPPGSQLRKLQLIGKEIDPNFGGLIRVQNKRREYLWVHERFVDQY